MLRVNHVERGNQHREAKEIAGRKCVNYTTVSKIFESTVQITFRIE